MSVLPIRIYPDPVLRAKCAEVDNFDEDLRKLAEDMAETMYAAPGIGLAAPQVGVEIRLAVVDIGADPENPDLHVLVNPEIVEETGSDLDLEGCLSIPEVSEKVSRPAAGIIRARNLDGESIELEMEGLLMRAVCHEIDHLDGVLFIDRLTGLRKDRAKRQLRRMLKEQEEATWQEGE